MQPHGGVCMMFGCPNHRKMKNGPSFYKFPKNKEICLKWVEKCKRDDLREMFAAKGPEYISKNHSLCSHHFTTKDFRNNNKPTQGIYPGAVPTEISAPKEEPFKPKKRKSKVKETKRTPSLEDIVTKIIHVHRLVSKYKKKSRKLEKQYTKLKADYNALT